MKSGLFRARIVIESPTMQGSLNATTARNDLHRTLFSLAGHRAHAQESSHIIYNDIVNILLRVYG